MQDLFLVNVTSRAYTGYHHDHMPFLQMLAAIGDDEDD